MVFDNYTNINSFSNLDIYSETLSNEYVKEIEERYSLENELIKAVSIGDYKLIAKRISAADFVNGIEKRTDNPIRNMQNYMIILNTIMRKGAELGNVHPFYIHEMSSDFARHIEQCETEQDIEAMWNEMIYSYCKLVKTHSAKGYSPLVKNIVLMVDVDLSENLTLAEIAKKFNVNASYLSSLFKRDTGLTLTEYVNTKRIERAKMLLTTTSMQIQTVARTCGIFDVNYFAKIFKKYTGKTPVQYRNENI